MTWRRRGVCATAGLGGTVVLGLPLDVQAAPAVAAGRRRDPADAGTARRAGRGGGRTARGRCCAGAQRPVFIAGRGAARTPATGRGRRWTRLADSCGALLAISAAAKGLFAGDPWNLDVSGGFATPLAAELIAARRPGRRLGQHAEHVDHPARHG